MTDIKLGTNLAIAGALSSAQETLMAEVREVHRLRALLWKTHRPTCKAVHEDVPCDCGATGEYSAEVER